MEDKRNLLVDSMPSPFFFVVTFSVLFAVCFLVARGLASMLEIDNLITIRFILMFVSIYGLVSGIILGAFKKKIGFVFVGAISGAVGTWINWAGIMMFSIWAVCYGAVLLVVSLVKRDSPVWTLMNAKTNMADALSRHPGLIFAAALVVAVFFLIGYVRLKFHKVYPTKESMKAPISVFVCVSVLTGLALAFMAPRVTQKQFVNESIETLPKRVNIAAVQGVNASICVRLMKFSGYEETKDKKSFAMPNSEETMEAPEKVKKPDVFFRDITINIVDGNITVEDGLGPKTQANVAVYLRHWMQVAKNEQTLSSLLDIGLASYTGSEDVIRATEPYFKPYRPKLHNAFKEIIITVVILLIGSFAVAPMICIYDAFHYWSQEWDSPEEAEAEA